MYRYIQREGQETLIELAKTFPVVAITGPRQSGKTTLAQHTFPSKRYLTLEDPDIRTGAQSDPREFLGNLQEGAILDEVQRAPELFSYLQGVVDEDRRPGKFVLTGSHQFLLDERISQTLAGRAGYLKLLPFNLREAEGRDRPARSLDETLWQGQYPSIVANKANPRLWYGAYVETYLERDVRQLINIRDLSAFQIFLRLCAGRTGNLLDIGGLSNEASINYRTARNWLSVLEASFVIHLLRPYHTNYRKRLVKTPKLYFLDTGLAAWLLGIKDPQQLESHPLRGCLFETLVVSEVLKHLYNRAEPGGIFFWRDSYKNEVDILLDRVSDRTAIEVKSGRTLNEAFLKGLNFWRSLDPRRNQKTVLVFGGDDSISARSGHKIVNWRSLHRALA